MKKQIDIPKTLTEKSETKILLATDYTCCFCRQSKEVQIHHIDGDNSNNAEINLIPLCQPCHNKAHTKYSHTKNVKKQFLIEAKDEWVKIVKHRKWFFPNGNSINELIKENETLSKVIGKITSPQNGELCFRAITCNGTASNVPISRELWLIKEVNGKFHPDRGPLIIFNDEWMGNAYISPNTEEFKLHLVLVPRPLGLFLNYYIDYCHALSPNWEGFSELINCKILSSINLKGGRIQ